MATYEWLYLLPFDTGKSFLDFRVNTKLVLEQHLNSTIQLPPTELQVHSAKTNMVCPQSSNQTP